MQKFNQLEGKRMNTEIRYEMQKKRLERMTAKVNELQSKVDAYKADEERMHKMISELEKMQSDWRKRIGELEDKKHEYDVLIQELKILRKKIKK